jgi:hypothetical protein
MAVDPKTLSVGKRYLRWTDVRIIISIDKDENVHYQIQNPANARNREPEFAQLPIKRFAEQVDEYPLS